LPKSDTQPKENNELRGEKNFRRKELLMTEKKKKTIMTYG